MIGKRVVVTSVVLAWGACLLHAQDEPPDRAAFARGMSAVTKGMRAEEVEEVLGKPDDVRTEFDPGGIGTSRTTEIWCYGTSGHLTCPTLGCVFMAAGAAQYVFGGSGTPPDPAMIAEAELKKLLQGIDALSESRGRDPLLYIQLVNTLHPLGKDKALAVIAEYLRVSSPYLGDRIPLFILLRLLFEVPGDPGFMPRMMVGAPSVKEPEDKKLIPLFPVVLMDDIPLNLVISYMLAGCPQPVEQHLEHFRRDGKWRERPLHPSDKPLEMLAALRRSPQWIFKDLNAGMNYEWQQNHLTNQLLELVRTVYFIEPDHFGQRLPGCRYDPQQWDKIVADVAALDIRWDAGKNIYVLADGSSLPEVKEPIHMRRIWKIPGLGPRADLIFERMNKDHVMLRLERSDPQRFESVVKVYRTGAPDTPLARYRIPATDIPASSQTSEDVFLPAGESLQAEITSNGATTKSPVFTP